MSLPVVFEDGRLKLEVKYESSRVSVKWLGESKEREPIRFISSVFEQIYEKDNHSPLYLDFTDLEYMNSSTVTPIVKQLEKAKKENRKITVVFRKSLKWQELSFSALKVFSIPEKVEIIGL